MKKYLEENVYEATMKRIKFIFEEFDNVLVSFSGGKDSGVMLNLCYDYAKKNNLLDKLSMYYMDYEADYQETYEYIKRSFDENFSGIKKILVVFTDFGSMFVFYDRDTLDSVG